MKKYLVELRGRDFKAEVPVRASGEDEARRRAIQINAADPQTPVAWVHSLATPGTPSPDSGGYI